MRSVVAAIYTYIAVGLGSLPGGGYTGLVVIGIFDKDPLIHKHQDNSGIYLFTIEL